MVLEFDRTIDDIIDFNLFHQDHSPSIKKQMWAYRVLFTLLIAFVPIIITYFMRDLVFTLNTILGLLVSVLFFVAFPNMARRSTAQRVQSMLNEGVNNSILGHCVMTLSPEGISTKAVGSESRIDWSKITKVSESEKHIFLYIGSINAYVIPKTAFTNDDVKREFLNYVSASTKKEVTG